MCTTDEPADKTDINNCDLMSNVMSYDDAAADDADLWSPTIKFDTVTSLPDDNCAVDGLPLVMDNMLLPDLSALEDFMDLTEFFVS